MPSIRTYHPILRSFNNAPVAMPSFATASRIPVPKCASVARVPIATARSIPRPVNSLSVARSYTPTVQRVRPSTTIASMAFSFAAMSISKPVNQAIARPSAPKPTASLPRVAARCSKLASDRIQARRQQVIARQAVARKRPTAPASTPQSLSMPSRAVPRSAVTAPVSILKTSSKPSRAIPPPPAQASASTLVSSWMPRSWSKPRGTDHYCDRRPREVDSDGNVLREDYQPLFYFGIECTCHARDEDRIGPRRWKTTPAEADVSALFRTRLPLQTRILCLEETMLTPTCAGGSKQIEVRPVCSQTCTIDQDVPALV